MKKSSTRILGALGLAVSVAALTLGTAVPAQAEAGPAASISITPDSGTFVAGSNIIIHVEGTDADGNDVGDLTSSATFTSSDASDGLSHAFQQTGWDVGVRTAGSHTITAHVGDLTADATFTVTPGPLTSLEFVDPPATAVAGATQTFHVNGFDAYGNPLGDETTSAQFGILSTSIFDPAPETFTGNSVVMERAGDRVVAASVGEGDERVQQDVTVTVTAGAAAAHKYAFVDPPTFGGPLQALAFPVSSTDAYGNLVHSVTAKLKTDKSSDSISGDVVKFHSAGNRPVIATVGTTKISTRIDIEKSTPTITFTSPSYAVAGAKTTVEATFAPTIPGVKATGTARVRYGAKYISVKIPSSEHISVTLPKLTHTGRFPIRIYYDGSTAYSADDTNTQEFDVIPGAVAGIRLGGVPGDMAYPEATKFEVETLDRYANVVDPAADPSLATITASHGATVDGTTVTFTEYGNQTVKVKYLGYTASTIIDVIRDFPSFSYPEAPNGLIAGEESHLQVQLSPKNSDMTPLGKVTLHVGSKAYPAASLTDLGVASTSTAEFDWTPAAAGQVTVYFTYAGSSTFRPWTSAKTKLTVAPAAN